MGELAGKTALVTGAASGIGAACASNLTDAGATVLTADIRASRMTYQCDVADEQSVSLMFGRVATDVKSLDIVVHSAGILIESNLTEMSMSDFSQLMDVNLRGTFLVGRGAMPLLKSSGDGRFVAVASELAYSGRAGFSAYCASKAGVIGLVRSWAREFAPHILVNALAPGPVDTPMLDIENMSAQWREKESDIPLGRVANPAEIAAVARFLVGPGASFMTGQTVSPNGGAVMF